MASFFLSTEPIYVERFGIKMQIPHFSERLIFSTRLYYVDRKTNQILLPLSKGLDLRFLRIEINYCIKLKRDAG